MIDDHVRVKVGQLWRRRRDGLAFIPAHRVAGGWIDKAGHRRTSTQLAENYVLVPIDEDAGTTDDR